MTFIRVLLITLCLVTVAALGVDEAPSTVEPSTGKVKYKGGKDVNFEELLIQGQLQRPEITVVTGNSQEGTDGLLRLRDDFLDRVASDFGEATE
jgi:hypothetical protein